MIIKFKNATGSWSWISNVQEMNSLGALDTTTLDRAFVTHHGADNLEHLGDTEVTDKPLILAITQPTGKRLLALYASEAYLTEDKSGSTIDVLIKPTRG